MNSGGTPPNGGGRGSNPLARHDDAKGLCVVTEWRGALTHKALVTDIPDSDSRLIVGWWHSPARDKVAPIKLTSRYLLCFLKIIPLLVQDRQGVSRCQSARETHLRYHFTLPRDFVVHDHYCHGAFGTHNFFVFCHSRMTRHLSFLTIFLQPDVIFAVEGVLFSPLLWPLL